MSELNLQSPLLSGFALLETYSDIGGVGVHLLLDKVTGKEYILKHISIPESETQIEGLRISGAIQNDDDAKAYYARVLQDYQKELSLLDRLAEEGMVSGFLSHKYEEKESGIGFDLYLLSEKHETLAQYMQKTTFTHLKAANLARDLCQSLSTLRALGLIHAGLKPSNIYLNNRGHFLLGDLGLYRIDQLKYASVPDTIFSEYSAPEMYDVMAPLNETTDIYAVGLILYKIYNGDHNPFEDERTNVKAAEQLRKSGATMPAPLYADYEITNIIFKACAFDPAERYQTPAELLDAISDYITRNEIGETLIIPPIVTDEDTSVNPEEIDETLEPLQITNPEELDETFKENFAPDTEPIALPEEDEQEEESPKDEQVTFDDLTDPAQEQSSETTEVTEELPAENEKPAENEPDAEEKEESASKAEEVKPGENTEVIEKEPVKKAKKSLPFWIWIIAGLLVLGAAAVAVWQFSIPKVTSVATKDVTNNSIVLLVEANKPLEEISAVCRDTYGNTIVGSLQDGKFVFSKLTAGTKYDFTFESLRGDKTKNISAYSETTLLTTEVLHFSAKPLSETQVQLYFTVSGADCENWVVSYTTGGAKPIEKAFTGHQVVIADLKPKSAYTFTLSSPDTAMLSGATSLIHDTTVSTSVTDISCKIQGDQATFTWAFTGKEPEKWNVTLTAPDGTAETTEVKEAKAVLTAPLKDAIYTAEIYCSGMGKAASKVFTTADINISDLAAKENADGSLSVTWKSEHTPKSGWKIVCTLVGNPGIYTEELSKEEKATVYCLLPASTYKIEVLTGDGAVVNGNSVMQIDTAEIQPFKDYGCTSTTLNFYLKPAKDAWGADDLGKSLGSFEKNEKIAFVLQCTSKRKESKDEVSALYVLKNTKGEVMDVSGEIKAWDDLWAENRYMRALENTPQQSGTYTLEIFFNGKFVIEKDFKIN